MPADLASRDRSASPLAGVASIAGLNEVHAPGSRFGALRIAPDAPARRKARVANGGRNYRLELSLECSFRTTPCDVRHRAFL